MIIILRKDGDWGIYKDNNCLPFTCMAQLSIFCNECVVNI